MVDFPGDDEHTQATLPPFVEVELVYETGHAGMKPSPWRALEIWTRNRIYSVDWTMRCIEVLDLKTNSPDPTHSLLGAKLAGGQVQHEDSIEVTFPCPRPGCEAVFEVKDRKGYVNTSTVTRVVLRLRVLTVSIKKADNTWDDLTGSWDK